MPTNHRWTHVALVRGINVGGKNIIRMAALQGALGKAGLDDVLTYIQSGNVLFASREPSAATLEARIEAAIARTFPCAPAVVVLNRKQMNDVVAAAPRGFGSAPG